MPFVLVAISIQEIRLVRMKELPNLVTDACSAASTPNSDTEMRVPVPLSFRTPTGHVHLAVV
jgi:hypothetical protein